MNTVGISLGNVCYSAFWATNNGMRKTRNEGYKTCPFDLMISNYKGTIACLNDNFSHLCDTNYLKMTPNGIVNTYYNFTFNHETPGHADLYLHENWQEGTNHFINNNFRNFKERYNRRICNFRQYLSNPNNSIIFIIQFVHDKTPNDNYSELRQALKNKYPNLKYYIQVIP